MVEAEIR